jgi:hypothetical protein
MNSNLIVTASVLGGISVLLFFLGTIFSATKKKLEFKIHEKFGHRELLGATTGANLFGLKSAGFQQIRGNGALILTHDKLVFLRIAPEKEYVIPVDSILNVSMPRSFNGKSVFRSLLHIKFAANEGEDEIAWGLKNPEVWKDAIDALIKHANS